MSDIPSLGSQTIGEFGQAVDLEGGEVRKNQDANLDGRDPQIAQANGEAGAENREGVPAELTYRGLFEAARVGILILDANTGRIADVNPFVVDLLGYSFEEMVGKTVGELSPFRDVESNQAMLERLQTHGYVRYEDLPLETRDGRHIAVEFVSSVYRAGDHCVIQCHIRDITARKGEAALYRRLAAIINSSDDAIIGKDLDGCVSSWNAGAEKIFGYSAQEMVGCSIMRLVPADRWAEEEKILTRLRRGESIEHFETVGLSKRGDPIQVSVTVSPVKDPEGNIVGASKIARDITGRKDAEEALRVSEARYVRIAANVPGMVYQLRLEPDGRFTYPFVSRGCLDIYGLDPAVLEGDAQAGMNMIHADDRPGFDASLIESAKSLRAWTWQGRIVRPDNGEIRSTHAAARPERQPDGAIVWDGVVMDITERARADENRRAKEIAERANLAKSEFISRMSHELRTPLNAILGFGQLLEQESLGSKQQESVHHIIGGGRQLLELINEVLDIAMVESGHMAMSLEEVSIQDLAQDTLTLIGPLAAARGIHCELLTPRAPGTGEKLAVTADKQRLRQVLLNLLSNAVKYNALSGRITVDFVIESGRVRLRVADTGPGVPAEMRARLFTAFDRLGAELQGIQGTGLGLALSRHLMEAMGGRLGVEEQIERIPEENRPGPGAVFWLELPLAAHAPAAAARLPEAPPDLAADVSLPRGRTILYIEDNVSNLRLVEIIMEAYPAVRLITATTGASGLDLALDYRPDLILLDLHLGDMPGRDVLARLRSEPRTRAIPVVIISADVADAQLNQMLDAGACACLKKPLELKSFLSVVRDALKGPRDSET